MRHRAFDFSCLACLTGAIALAACSSSDSSSSGPGSDGGSGGFTTGSAAGGSTTGTSTSTAGTSAGTAGTTGTSAGTAGNGGSNGSGSTPSSGGGGAIGSFSSSVPASTMLNGLSSSQLQTLCGELQSYLLTIDGPAFELDCRFVGFFDAALSNPATDAAAQSACQQQYSACIAAPPSTSNANCAQAPSASCTATVGELTACLNDSAAGLSAALNAVPSCSSLTLADLRASDDGGTSDPGNPPSCDTYQQKCPEAFGKPTMTGGVTP